MFQPGNRAVLGRWIEAVVVWCMWCKNSEYNFFPAGTLCAHHVYSQGKAPKHTRILVFITAWVTHTRLLIMSMWCRKSNAGIADAHNKSKVTPHTPQFEGLIVCDWTWCKQMCNVAPFMQNPMKKQRMKDGDNKWRYILEGALTEWSVPVYIHVF